MELEIKAIYGFVFMLILKVLFNRLLIQTMIYQNNRVDIKNYLHPIDNPIERKEKVRRIIKFLLDNDE